MTETKKTLYLIDGSALIYRSYFAFIRNPLINSKGENTSTAFGVSNILLSLIRNRKPDYLAAAFDTREPTFRHHLYEQYKATRQKMPKDMEYQLPRAREAFEALGVRVIEMGGFEADDIIGTLAVQGAREGFEVFMFTSDKDFMQLLGPGISMYVPVKEEVVTAATVQERFGFPPERVTDLMGLMGDASDNIPGVPKVGEKTALALLRQFPSFDAIFNRAEEIDKPSVRKNIQDNRELAYLSRDLATIHIDVPLKIDLESFRFPDIDRESARDFFRNMEFNSLTAPGAKPVGVVETVTAETVDAFLAELENAAEFSLATEAAGEDAMHAVLVGISFAIPGKNWYLPIAHDKGQNVLRDLFFPRLNRLLADSGKVKIGHDIKKDMIVLKRYGLSPAPFSFDTMLAAYVLDPGSKSYALDRIAVEFLNRPLQTMTDLTGKGKNQCSFNTVEISDAALFSGDRTGAALELKALLAPRLDAEKLAPLFHEVEMPLAHVLADMEMKGILLDLPLLKQMSDDLTVQMAQAERRIYEAAGEEFNINSPKQLADILFGKLGLRPVRKTKTGYGTDIDVLMKLSHKHPLPELILQYRQVMKLKSTYVDALPALVNPETGRVHTSFNQAVTVTGRLSSSDPNLQNIPVRSEQGREIRKAFIAPPGHIILSADYSQVELRIMAHLSNDPALIDAFAQGVDVHTQTASILFGIFPEIVTAEDRRRAKTINFGVMYGMGAYALSEQLGISREEAKAYIDNYFRTHAGVRDYIDRTIREAELRGYVTTMLGRKRYLPEIKSPNFNIAEFNKRTAVNTPLQGTAADLIKVSMISLARKLKEHGLASALILQVHDELVLEVPEHERDETASIVRECMEGGLTLSIPLVVDIGVGANWFEAH